MAYNAFTEIVVDESNDTIILKGQSPEPLGPNAQIVVAVMQDPNDEDAARLQGDVNDAQDNPWVAEFPLDGAPFKNGDEVVVAGMARSDEDDIFVWGDKRTIDLKSG